MDDFLQSGNVTIVPLSPELFTRSYLLYRAYLDKQ